MFIPDVQIFISFQISESDVQPVQPFIPDGFFFLPLVDVFEKMSQTLLGWLNCLASGIRDLKDLKGTSFSFKQLR